MEALELLSPSRGSLAKQPVFASGLREHAEQFGAAPFLMRHNLAASELFELPRLREIGRALLARERSGRAKDAEVSLPEWRPVSAKARSLSKAEQFEKAFDEIEADSLHSGCKLSGLNEVDPAYDAVMRKGVRQISKETDVPLDEISWSILTVFISAPRILTPYHADYNQNCLLQVRGEKLIRMYESDDRNFIPQNAIEGLCKGYPLAAPYRDEFEDQGTVFRLEPGVGIHIPVTAPHSLVNGDDVSISVAIAFCTRKMDDIAHVHQANLFLRAAGLRPPFPDLSRRGDQLKAGFFRTISGPRDSYPALARGYRRLVSPARAVREVWKRQRETAEAALGG